MDVGRFNGRHLPPLYVGDSIVRIEDEEVDRLAVAARLDRRGAGVSRGGSDDCYAFAAASQHRVEHQSDQLQCEVLERKRRPVKELQ